MHIKLNIPLKVKKYDTKIIHVVLMLVAVFMGLNQGYAMFSGKLEMLEMFAKGYFNKTGVMLIGAVAILSAVLIIFPWTFVRDNFLVTA